MRTKSGVVLLSLLLACAAAQAPLEAWAQTVTELSDGRNDMCLVNVNGVPSMCSVNGPPFGIGQDGWPITINANKGDDQIRVKGTSTGGQDSGDCPCTCSGAGVTNFGYAGTLQINGEEGHDTLYAADGDGEVNILTGGTDYDYLRGGRGNFDYLYGNDGADVMYDPGGEGDVFKGGNQWDDMRDRFCIFNAILCDCQGGSGKFWGCVDNDCANCDETSGTFWLACPP
jgi:hypothetical protein